MSARGPTLHNSTRKRGQCQQDPDSDVNAYMNGNVRKKETQCKEIGTQEQGIHGEERKVVHRTKEANKEGAKQWRERCENK
jgi:hypothetical protein